MDRRATWGKTTGLLLVGLVAFTSACQSPTLESGAAIALSVAGHVSLAIGESVQLEVTVSTAKPRSIYAVKYQSENSNVTVSDTGVMTGVSNGTGTITVTATLIDTGAAATASVTVDVGGGSAIADMASVGQPPDLGPTAYATPKVAGLDYSGVQTSTAKQAALAKFNFIIIGLGPSNGISNIASALNNIKSMNPSVKIANYTILIEFADPYAGDEVARGQELDANDWWLRNTAGEQVTWTTEYGTYEINISDWAPVNALGERYPQFLARWQTTEVFGKLPQFDYVFNDNVFSDSFNGQLIDADWQRNGTNQSLSDPLIQSEMRKGYVHYWDKLRALNPAIKIIGNGSDLGSAEFKGQIEGQFMECLMGRSWSTESWASDGWSQNLTEYRQALLNTRAPHDVVFQVCGSSNTDYALMRYGLATAMLDDGWYMYSGSDYFSAPWFDEFDAPIGRPTEAPPVAATSSGIWRRTYENGMVLVNPSKTTTSTLSVPAGYRRLQGSQDPGVNSGAAATSVTLAPRSGLLLLKQ
jgi:hypothetical protein